MIALIKKNKRIKIYKIKIKVIRTSHRDYYIYKKIK